MIKTSSLVAAGLLFTATAAFADVHINEIDADQVSTDTAEFIELYDGGVGNTDLTGLVVVLFNGSDDQSYNVTSSSQAPFDLDGLQTDANGYFVIGGKDVPGIDARDAAGTGIKVHRDDDTDADSWLQQGSDAVALYTGDASDFPNDTPVTTTNLLDAIVYDTNDDDDPGLLVLLNADQPQVNESGGAGSTTDSNQRCPNGSGGGRNTDTYLQAIPTPGGENSCAEVFGACCDDSTGECIDGVAEASCVGAGNRYGGDGSDCVGIDPPCEGPPSGACCDDSTGECTDDVTQDDCEGAGNRYGGDGSTCADIDPPCVAPPTGACCSAGFCGEDVSQIGCETGGGTYQGDDSQCPQDCGTESTVMINEIRIDNPGTDVDEYFELAGGANESLAGLTYIVIGDGSGGSGTIEAVIDLTGTSIGASGLFVAAESTFTLGTPDLETNLNFENSDNVTHLLVAGFSGTNGDDLDLDDDGTLDTEPWAGVVSCVALVETPGEGDQIYCGVTVGPDGAYVPGHAYFCESGNVWVIGGFEVGSDDTPGAENPSCTTQCTGGGVAPAIAINEIRVKQSGSDIDEYFELSGGAFTPLEGVAYVVIGDSSENGSGIVEEVICLNGQFLLGDGLFAVAEDTFTIGDGVADLELPAGELNFVDADPRTHLLVLNFNGIIGQDVDSDDDGILDVDLPWDEIIDDVALVGLDVPCTEGVACIYSDNIAGPDGDYSPGHVYRCEPDLTWTVGAFDTQPDQPECAQDTPGDPNESCDFAPPCGCIDAGSCFQANGTPNCDDAACCDLIISGFDATCADDWDQACVDLALIECLGCGAEAAGNCLEVNGTPYCNDTACCDQVCAIDSTCCQLPDGWDADCVALAQDCDIPDPVNPGDVVFGLSVEDEFATLELLRGPGSENGGVVVTDSWEEAWIQSVEFDNLNGIAHNNRGNLLALSFGSDPATDGTGGTIHSLSTCVATSTDQFIGDTLSEGGKGLTVTRLGGLSVSPDNTKIAVSGYDSQKVIVYDYTAGNCAGAGASLSNARETIGDILCDTGDTQGTAWLDNDTVLVFSTNGEILAVDANTMASEVVATVPVEGAANCDGSFTDLEYNPQISPNVYAMYGDYVPAEGTTISTLFILDPTDEFNLLDTLDYSTSIPETTREIAFDACGNLYVTQHSGIIDVIVDAANLASLVSNNSLNWYASPTFSFASGLDVAIGDAGCVVDKCGDGFCDDSEDACNCPADCPGSCCGDCPHDIGPPGPNGNVGPEDLGELLGCWGPVTPGDACECLDIGPPGPNGSIGPEDLGELLGAWGPC